MRPGSGGAKRSSLTRSSRTSTFDRDLRDERHAIAVGDHLHDGRKARRTEPQRGLAARTATIGERLVAQAMALLEQDQPRPVDL